MLRAGPPITLLDVPDEAPRFLSEAEAAELLAASKYLRVDSNDWYSPATIGAGQWQANLIVESFSDSKQIANGHAKAAEMQWDAMSALDGIASERSAAAPRLVDLDAQGSALAAALSITINIKE